MKFLRASENEIAGKSWCLQSAEGGIEEALKAVAGIEIVQKNRKLRSRMFPFKDSA